MRRRTVQEWVTWSIVRFAMVLVVMQASAGAEVADSAANGFTVKITTQIQAAPAEVYRRILRIGDWWNPEHTYSGDSHNLSIEPRADGCFCEKLPNGGGVRHMNVVLLMPGEMLRMSGGLGPLGQMGLAGSMTFTLEPAGAGTKLGFTYA
ncbi:MAG: SRPBCC family protein, partial [Acidobacteria bacterium]|nr:SRPBCC family protein [Acidobacteriota bacterium]